MRLLAALACSTALLVATLAPSVTTGASAEEQPTAAQQVLAEARALLTGATGEGDDDIVDAEVVDETDADGSADGQDESK